MLLIAIFLELRVVAGRSRKRAGSPQAVSRRPCCAVALRRTAWTRHGHGMASVNQTRPHCVNQMGKTHSKLLAAQHGRATAWVQHAMCESAFKEPRYPFSRRLGGPHSQSERLEKTKNPFPVPRIEPQTVQSVA
jgi:hypothetical protein